MGMSEAVFQAAWEAYKDHVFAIGFNYFRNTVDADDVVQETFLKLYRRSEPFESQAHLQNWLYRVAVNECKRVSLSSWRKKRVSLEAYAETLSFTSTAENSLFLAVMRLPKKLRQVIHLYYFEGYATAEIGDLLGISQSAVTSRLLRGREKLKQILPEVWKDE